MAKKDKDQVENSAIDLGASVEGVDSPSEVQEEEKKQDVAPVVPAADSIVSASVAENASASAEVSSPVPAISENAEIDEEDAQSHLDNLLAQKAEIEEAARVASEKVEAAQAERQAQAAKDLEERADYEIRAKKSYVESTSAFKALHDFKAAMDGTVLNFTKDQVITDKPTMLFLLSNNLPVVALNENVDFFFCKHCHTQNLISR